MCVRLQKTLWISYNNILFITIKDSSFCKRKYDIKILHASCVSKNYTFMSISLVFAWFINNLSSLCCLYNTCIFPYIWVAFNPYKWHANSIECGWLYHVRTLIILNESKFTLDFSVVGSWKTDWRLQVSSSIPKSRRWIRLGRRVY